MLKKKKYIILDVETVLSNKELNDKVWWQCKILLDYGIEELKVNQIRVKNLK